MSTNNARFIAVEGLDGSGKSTQAKLLSEFLLKRNIPNVLNFEPTDSTIGKQIRTILSGKEKVHSRTMALLFAADRIEHITGENGILKNLENGISVISDRYYFSSYAYQMVSMPLEWVMEINRVARTLARPDAHIFIDVTAETCLERIAQNRESADIFENKKYLTQTRENFLRIIEKTAKEENVIVIDGNADLETVSSRVIEAVKPLF
ncbi:MAG: dTMP kinase [Oscillospiraceae bacterium]|nr:dTMP kinase [Oscillospiraceae bacterium]